MAKVKPFKNDIVMVQFELNTKSNGGIIMGKGEIPKNIGTFVGKVISLGEEVIKRGNFEVGMIIVTHLGKLKQLPLLDKTFWIGKEEDICGFIELEDGEFENEGTIVH